VVVERHRLDADGRGDLAHRQRLEAAAVGELERRAQHALPGQWLSSSWAHRLDNLTV
jgi:hypothetical protein